MSEVGVVLEAVQEAGLEVDRADGSVGICDEDRDALPAGSPLSDGLTWVHRAMEHPEKIGIAAGFKDLTPLHGKWIRQMVFGRRIIPCRLIAVRINPPVWRWQSL